jgi:hypothetical protein
MSATTVDSFNFDGMKDSKGSLPFAPFVKKELNYVVDNNGGSNVYSRNQVEFDTTTMAGNDMWGDYRNGFISIPVVATVERSAGELSQLQARELLRFKSGNHTLIDSISIKYGNSPVIQEQAGVNAYLSFRQHSEWSLNEALLNSHTGYRKDSTNWSYDNAMGMINNAYDLSDTTFIDHLGSNRGAVLSGTDVVGSGVNFNDLGGAITPPAGGNAAKSLVHVFYYDCIIRLKDLPFFAKLDPVRFASIKINIKLNQSVSVLTYAASELTGQQTGLKGYSNFALRSDKHPVAAGTETISVNVVSGKVGNDTFTHIKTECRLYVPYYALEASAKESYLALGSKKVLYEDVDMRVIKVEAGKQISGQITNSQSRVRRLIIVPMLAADGNVPAAHESCLSTEPSTCSPCFIKNFNVVVGNQNHYAEDMEFKYMNYLSELNGNYGINHNQVTGLTSSMISQHDFNQNYGYIVVDLSRKYASDDNLPLNIRITGQNVSHKALNLHCFLEYNKDITIDIATGERQD